MKFKRQKNMNVNIDNFEGIVDPKVLDRGINYLENGSVTEIEELDKNDFNAIVMGTEVYSVNIVLNKKEELFTHECNCPYDFGPICKHKVAVLLLIRRNKRDGTVLKKGNLTKIKQELKSYQKNELLQLIMNLAKSNIRTRNSLLFELGFEDYEDYEEDDSYY